MPNKFTKYAPLFDFGIFVDVLQSGISESTNYPQKFSNCFWWGLRNLSSLGSNLQRSSTWENLYAAFISVIGLLLFLYLTGNLQTYMQSELQELKSKIMKKVKQELEQDRDVDVEKILSILPLRLQTYINSCMVWKKHKAVPKLQSMDEEV
ncbi:hypothetical protein L3X38_014135 [Prunus dulcis]|uniref:Uncharacterized protein n=1 Tax=Prunus dulcis TaxID=3755 RepID=A0AAD4WN89_PRUDU|nr:hypothetical protein L3X38_014135 [Prunus dulcis]